MIAKKIYLPPSKNVYVCTSDSYFIEDDEIIYYERLKNKVSGYYSRFKLNSTFYYYFISIDFVVFCFPFIIS